MADSSSAPSIDVQASLNFLTDLLTIHFKNLRDADSCFFHDHATILKDHINRIAAERPKGKETSDFMDSKHLAGLPRAISRFAPRATVNPGLNWGLIGKLPRELRDIVYNAALLSHDCHPTTYIQACTCTQESRRSQSGLGLLRTCAKIHNEALPLIYAPETFALTLGLPENTSALESDQFPEWQDPRFYRDTILGQQLIHRLPHHAFHLIQSLSLTFTTEVTAWGDERLSVGMVDQLLHRLGQDIAQICSLLRDEAMSLQYLDVTVSVCLPSNSQTNDGNGQHDRNAVIYQLLEPLLQLRGIPEASITLRGFEVPTDDNASKFFFPDSPQPRWELTDDFVAYVGSVLGSSRETRVPGFTEGNIGDAEMLDDDYEDEGGMDEWISGHEDEEQFMQKYLWEVYGTEDLKALYGGMPDRWQVWLNSDHEKGCDWFDTDDEDEDEESL